MSDVNLVEMINVWFLSLDMDNRSTNAGHTKPHTAAIPFLFIYLLHSPVIEVACNCCARSSPQKEKVFIFLLSSSRLFFFCSSEKIISNQSIVYFVIIIFARTWMTVELASRLNTLFSVFSKHKQVGHPAAAGAFIHLEHNAHCVLHKYWIRMDSYNFSHFEFEFHPRIIFGSNEIIWSR